MPRQDHYDVLGVSEDASDDEIRRAFRRLAAQHHPDRNPRDRSASLRFKQIGAAYDVLSDPGKRRAYDSLTRGPDATRTGASAPPPRPTRPPPQAPPPRPEPDQPPLEARSWSWRPPPPGQQRRSSAPPPRSEHTPQPEADPPSAEDHGRVAHPGRIRWVRRFTLRAAPAAAALTTALALFAIVFSVKNSHRVWALDVQTGGPVYVSQEVASSQYTSGRIRFESRTRIPVRLDGQERTIDESELDAALHDHAAELNFDPLDATKATVTGALRGLTLGASNWLAVEGLNLLGYREGAERTREVLAALEQDQGPAYALGLLAGVSLLLVNASLYLAARLLAGLRCPRCKSPILEGDAACADCGQAFWTTGADTRLGGLAPTLLMAAVVAVPFYLVAGGTETDKRSPPPPVPSASFAPMYTTQPVETGPSSNAAPVPHGPARQPSGAPDLDTQCTHNASCAECRDMGGASTPEQRAALAPGCYARWLEPSSKPQAPPPRTASPDDALWDRCKKNDASACQTLCYSGRPPPLPGMACFTLGAMYANANDAPTALDLLRKSCALGCTEACQELRKFLPTP